MHTRLDYIVNSCKSCNVVTLTFNQFMAKEREIEQKLCKAIKAIGGLCLKFVSPGYAGVPDRLILIANAKIAFVEVKAPGKKPRPIQVATINKIRSLGFKVYVLDDEKEIGGIINDISTT